MNEWDDPLEELEQRMKQLEQSEKEVGEGERASLYLELSLKHYQKYREDRDLNENLEKLFAKLLPKNKRRVMFHLIEFIAVMRNLQNEIGALDFDEVAPLQEAKELASVSDRQYRKYLKGNAIPSAKVINNAFNNLPKGFQIKILLQDLGDKLKLVQDEFPSVAESKNKHSGLPPRTPKTLPSGWGKKGLGNKYMWSPRFKIYQENGEYVLEYEDYGFTFSTVKFRTDEEKIKEFFDSGIPPQHSDWNSSQHTDWSTFKEMLDSKLKILPRLEGNPDLAEYIRKKTLLTHMMGGVFRSGLGRFHSPSPFSDDIQIFFSYRSMIRALEEGREDADIFKGRSYKEIKRILEFAEQLGLGEDKKSKLKKLLKEGKEND